MELDWNFLPSLISAASGLSGVWLGGRLTSSREAKRERERLEKDASYLAILVVAHLDRFANGCLYVALDDGTSEGRPAGDNDFHRATVQPPVFDPLELKVEWKALPADLMYGILNLPYRAEQLASHVSGVWEFDDPPDFTETFWTRQYGYAVLGLEVSELALQLRQYAGLPIKPAKAGDWSRDDALREQRDKIAGEREAYERRRQAEWQRSSPPFPVGPVHDSAAIS